MKIIELPCYKITIYLENADPLRPGAYRNGTVTSELHDDHESPVQRAAWDVVESIVMAHAIAGIDVTTPAYVEGVETTVDSIINELGDLSI